MTHEEAFHAFVDGLQPHLREHVGTHVRGDLEAAMAMAQRMEVFRPVNKPKAGPSDKKGDKSQKSNKNRQGGNAQVDGSASAGNVNAVQGGQQNKKQGQKKKDQKQKRKLQCHNCGGEHLLHDYKEWKEIKEKLRASGSSSGN